MQKEQINYSCGGIMYILFFVLCCALCVYLYRQGKKERARLMHITAENRQKTLDGVDVISSFSSAISLNKLHAFDSPIHDVQQRIRTLFFDHAAQLARAHAATLWRFDDTQRKWFIEASHGVPKDMVTLIEHTGVDDGTVNMPDIPLVVASMHTGNPLEQYYAHRPCICIPIKCAGKTTAMLQLVTHDEQNTHVYAKLLSVLAEQTANVLDNLALYHNMQNMSFSTLKTLGRAIDAKSPYTRKHTERVTEYTRAIIQRITFDATVDTDALKKTIEVAAMLHDIGKIGVKESILDKEGKLTDDEWNVMCMHPLIGERIISPIPSFSDVAPLVLYHHERYDGKGYLEGLSGERVPLGARIIAVADSFDAMTSDRSYRKAFSPEYALQEIQRCAGTQFDPHVVDAFASYLSETQQKN